MRNQPIASDADRIEAARLAAEKLRTALEWRPRRGRRTHRVWDHFTDSVGGVTSVLRRRTLLR